MSINVRYILNRLVSGFPIQMAEDLQATITERLDTYLVNNSTLSQKGLPQDVRVNLVKCLLDGSVYSVVNSLMHLQELKET